MSPLLLKPTSYIHVTGRVEEESVTLGSLLKREREEVGRVHFRLE
jgi:hypothetical protein